MVSNDELPLSKIETQRCQVRRAQIPDLAIKYDEHGGQVRERSTAAMANSACLPVHSNQLPNASIPDFDIPSGGSDERKRSRIIQRNENGVVVSKLGILQLLVVELDQLKECSMA